MIDSGVIPEHAVGSSFVLKRPSLAQQLVTFALLADKTARSKLTYRLSTLLSLVASGFAYWR